MPLCAACAQTFTRVTPPICPRCGTPLSGTNSHLCGECIKDPPPFEGARSLFAFEGKARDFIYLLKFHQNLGTLTLLDFWLRGEDVPFSAEGIDVVVPVPQTSKGLRGRGYNPAQLLASRVSKRFKKPLIRNHLVKIKETPPQIGLTKGQRRSNLKGAFAVRDKDRFRVKSVLLVDDVYTTGATVRECARVLKRGGARAVKVWTFARTILT